MTQDSVVDIHTCPRHDGQLLLKLLVGGPEVDLQGGSEGLDDAGEDKSVEVEAASR